MEDEAAKQSPPDGVAQSLEQTQTSASAPLCGRPNIALVMAGVTKTPSSPFEVSSLTPPPPSQIAT